MAWKYCDACGSELDEPEIEDFVCSQVPSCECGEIIDCDKEEIMLNTIITLREGLHDALAKLEALCPEK